MSESPSPPLSGRRAEAARNDERILAAAREVFIEDPDAPISAVAHRAGVGISALYRRYDGKEDLLRRLCGDGLRFYIAKAEAALADQGDPWTAFTTFMERLVDADTSSLTLRLAGTFTPTPELYNDAARAQELDVQLIERLKSVGAFRADADVNDVALILEQLAAIRVGDPDRTRVLRRRYLQLVLDALGAPGANPLPGPPPNWDEIRGQWDPE